MIVLHFSLQGEAIIEHISGKYACVLHFNMQGEDIIEHTNDKYACVYISVCKRMTFL